MLMNLEEFKKKLVERMRKDNPFFVTDLTRKESYL